ncbi:MAG: hypothetical protein ABJC19_07970 [Gemmatimonadota bacterium]
MRFPALAVLLAGSLAAAPLAAQVATPVSASAAVSASAVTLPLGFYRITMRDSTMVLPVQLSMQLLANGTYEIRSPEGASITGKATQQNGVLSWSGSRCEAPGEFTVRAEGDTFVLDVKDDKCEGRRDQMIRLRFTPIPQP